MTIKNTIQMGLLSLTLVTPMYAAPRHRDVQVVDVNAHALPPAPPHAKHVVVVNSAQRAPRRHGIAGMFQRLHQWHMRQRASLYRNLNSK
jgi:hypothetical protein